MNNYDDIKRFKEKLNMEGIDYKEIAESNPNITAHNWAIIKQVATADEPFHPLEQGRPTQPTPAPVSDKEFSASPLGQPLAAQQPRAGGNINRDIGAINAHYQPQASTAAESFASPLMSAVGKALPAIGPVAPVATPQDGNAPAGAAFLNAIQQEFAAPPAAVPTRSQEPAAASPFDAGQHGRPAAASPFDAGQHGRPAAASLFDAGQHGRPAAASLFDAARHDQPARTSSTAASSVRAPANAAGTMRFNSLFNRKSQSSAMPSGRDTLLSLLLENIALCR
ncbi:hypothetical protein [Sodalis sp. RH22]|uniref:hypothetical protein n=1 Tax=unclassified Sodalis (in: enterobacteria) TaxID=2636512 RepID=UPI0039B561C6